MLFLRKHPTLAILMVAAAACGGNPKPEAAEPNQTAAVEVENQGFADMTIYALSPTSARVRLGLAVGNTTQVFTLPAFLVGRGTPVRFLADPVGGTRPPVSEELTVEAGDTVTLRIPP
jgi:hypothetical protein